ncbi:MAG: hypothetical protein JJP05_08225 [cyanobacterium endosymbiont of Rhopalodia gibba]
MFTNLCQKRLQVIPCLQQKMRINLVKLIKTISLSQCLAIEIINDQLKNLSKIEHFRYRTVRTVWFNLLLD